MLSSSSNLHPAIHAGSRYWGCHHFDVRHQKYALSTDPLPTADVFASLGTSPATITLPRKDLRPTRGKEYDPLPLGLLC